MFLTKLDNAAKKMYADRAMPLDNDQLLFEQNPERRTRESARQTMVGRALVMPTEDIREA
jgi:hypothetical protein